MAVCYIVGAGEPHGSFTPEKDDLVIAADGGYLTLRALGIEPDILIGDFDSIDSVPEGVEILRHPVEKDETDTELAYLEGVRRGYKCFEIYGGTGGRPDHTYANYCLLLKAREHGHRARLIGESFSASVILNETTRVSGNAGKTLSVFAFGRDSRGVDIRGLKYGMHDGIIRSSSSIGVSNSFVSDEGEISVKDGALLIITEF